MAETIQGREYLIEIWDAVASTFKLIGGIQTRSVGNDNPTTDVTSSSSSGNYTENVFNGFSSQTVNFNGVVDMRESDELAAFSLFSDVANLSPTREARLRISNAVEELEGVYVVTSLETAAEQQGQITFTASMLSAGTITRLPAAT